MTKSITKTNYTYAVGRRRAAVVTVKLLKGKGESTINGDKISTYFPGEHNQFIYDQPLKVTELTDKYYFQAKAVGGGKSGQIEALTLAVSRCLKKIDDTAYGSALRAANLLTVDSRVRQRRQVGTGGKARRQKQSPKR